MDLTVGLIEILETNQAPEKNDIQYVINVTVELQYANEIEWPFSVFFTVLAA